MLSGADHAIAGMVPLCAPHAVVAAAALLVPRDGVLPPKAARAAHPLLLRIPRRTKQSFTYDIYIQTEPLTTSGPVFFFFITGSQLP